MRKHTTWCTSQNTVVLGHIAIENNDFHNFIPCSVPFDLCAAKSVRLPEMVGGYAKFTMSTVARVASFLYILPSFWFSFAHHFCYSTISVQRPRRLLAFRFPRGFTIQTRPISLGIHMCTLPEAVRTNNIRLRAVLIGP